MKAHLARMTHDEVYRWMEQQGRQAFWAWHLGEISREQYEDLHNDALQNYFEWCRAQAKGYLKPGE